MDLRNTIRNVPDFPIKGIQFKDITTLLKDKEALSLAVKQLALKVKELDFDFVVSMEARGFIFGSLLAYELNKGFIPLRKKGKLPAQTISETYEKEYGLDTIEMHLDALKKGDKVLIVDDLLATGGTCKAAVNLVEKTGATVSALAFLIELSYLNSRKLFEGYKVISLIDYESERE
ncbi:MAG: adenine phosphoribosyltransferase [archaeon]